MRIIYFCLGWVMVALGVIGLVMPLMPGVVFLIPAGGMAARSSDIRQTAAGLACRRGDPASGQSDGLRGDDDGICHVLV
jgi:hypothetical protein